MTLTSLDGPSVNGTGGEGAGSEPLRTTPSHVFNAKRSMANAKGLLRGEPTDEHINRALDELDAAREILAAELLVRNAKRDEQRRSGLRIDAQSLTDTWGRPRSPATLPGFNQGRTPRNKGRRFGPTPPSVDEVMRMVACCPDTPHGQRLKALLFILWNGARINEALTLEEHDLDQERSSMHIRYGKGGKQRLIGVPRWFWAELDAWLTHRQTLPPGPVFCILQGATAGQPWNSSAVRKALPLLAAEAGVRRRVAPHQLRHAAAVRMLHEGFDIVTISRHLGHGDLAITSKYLEGVSQDDVIAAVSKSAVPSVSAVSILQQARAQLAKDAT